jgi:GNAT superfamily N-acetyltransferase
MKLRVTRHTDQLGALTAFYRDGVGFAELGSFTAHDGYDGVFLAVPGTGTHLELTSGGSHPGPSAHPESLLVLYLDTQAEIDAIAARIGQPPVVPANPFWRESAVAFEDPDGFQVLLTLGDVPGGAERPIRIEQHAGSRAELRPLFELADDSRNELDAYIALGRVLVAVEGGQFVGHLQITETAAAGEAEIRNLAVLESHRGRGVGRALIEAVIDLARSESCTRLLVGTAAADVGNLRFYQRAGFRMDSVERDAFTPATGYDAGIDIDGVELRDRVWLDLPLGS